MSGKTSLTTLPVSVLVLVTAAFTLLANLSILVIGTLKIGKKVWSSPLGNVGSRSKSQASLCSTTCSTSVVILTMLTIAGLVSTVPTS